MAATDIATPAPLPEPLPGRMPGDVGRPIVSRRDVHPYTVVLIASLGMFMAFVDHTVVSVAFPNLLQSFPDAGLGSLSWVISAYNIVFAAFLVPAGRVADLLGRRQTPPAGARGAAAAAPQKLSFPPGGDFISETRREVDLYLTSRRVRARGVALLYAKGLLAFALTAASWAVLVFMTQSPSAQRAEARRLFAAGRPAIGRP